MLKMLFSSSKDILKNLQGLFIGLLITTSWLVFLTTVSFLHKEVFYPSPPALHSGWLPTKEHLPGTEWDFTFAPDLPFPSIRLSLKFYLLQMPSLLRRELLHTPHKIQIQSALSIHKRFSILSMSCRSQAYFSTTQLVWLSRFKHILN